MNLTIATWNINSVRLRADHVNRFLKEFEPDVLCLQEIKCQEAQFPSASLSVDGYEHIAIHGQKAYHGVAVVSRLPLSNIQRQKYCDREDARHISVTVDAAGKPVTIHNFYVPAGGDDPDPVTNWKFKHKLDFLNEMERDLPNAAKKSSVIVGDLNIAPHENDVWSHKQLLKVVSHTPVETEGLEKLRASGGWSDIVRQFIPPEDKLFTWWSYRSPNWEASDRGRRLDHVWATPDLAREAKAVDVVKDARRWEKPSDHIPVIATFAR